MGHARDTTSTPDHGSDAQQPDSVAPGTEAPQDREGLGSPQILRDVAEQVRENFLQPMEGTELVLIDVDPLVLHAFWRVPLLHFRAAQTRLALDDALAPMFLRIEPVDEHDQGSNGTADAFDVRVSGLQNRAYVDVHSDHRMFRASLGLRGKDGAFAELARSNAAQLPPLGPEGQKRRDSAPTPIIVPAWESQVPDTPNGRVDSQQEDEKPGPPMPPESSVPQPGEPWPEELLAPFALPDAVELDIQAPPGVNEGDARPISQSSDSPVAQDSGASPPASEQAPDQGNGAATDEPFALDEVLPLSSYVFASSGEDVDLEVTAELHIYGRVKPGRSVQLCGKPVKLRPDGSFSIRRVLPNDPQLVSALLASADAPETGGNG